MSRIGAEKRSLPHPSNTLYRGECGSFREAMELVMAQCDQETVESEHPDDKKLNESLAKFKATARECLEFYNKSVGKTERTIFERWSQCEDENLQLIGKAALEGDYSTLAI